MFVHTTYLPSRAIVQLILPVHDFNSDCQS